MCFKDQFNNILVGKSFSYPTPGNCKIFNGFFNNTDYAVSGNACTTSNGFYVNFNLITSVTGGVPNTNIAKLYSFYTTRDGTVMGFGSNCDIVGGSGCVTLTDMFKVPCPSPRQYNP